MVSVQRTASKQDLFHVKTNQQGIPETEEVKISNFIANNSTYDLTGNNNVFAKAFDRLT